ncbi:MAG: glycosyltransferase [Ilumatobacteraceae bacterium]
MLPSATIVIPVHNEERCIGAAIESALTGQTLADVLVVDDHSDDRTVEIANRYDRVTVVTCIGHGIVDVNNTALSSASGEVVIHLDADDRLLPGAVQSLLEAFADPDVVIASGSTITDDGSRVIDSKLAFPTHQHLSIAAAAMNPFSHSGVALRRESVLAIGGYTAYGDVSWGEDYDLWLRILGSGAKAAGVEALVASKTLRAEGISGRHHHVMQQRSRRARQVYRAGLALPTCSELVALGRELQTAERRSDLQQRWSVTLAILARQLRGDGRLREALEVGAAAVRLGPARLARGSIDHRARMRRRRRVRSS